MTFWRSRPPSALGGWCLFLLGRWWPPWRLGRTAHTSVYFTPPTLSSSQQVIKDMWRKPASGSPVGFTVNKTSHRPHVWNTKRSAAFAACISDRGCCASTNSIYLCIWCKDRIQETEYEGHRTLDIFQEYWFDKDWLFLVRPQTFNIIFEHWNIELETFKWMTFLSEWRKFKYLSLLPCEMSFLWALKGPKEINKKVLQVNDAQRHCWKVRVHLNGNGKEIYCSEMFNRVPLRSVSSPAAPVFKPDLLQLPLALFWLEA